MYHLSNKELNYLESLQDDLGSNAYLLGIINKQTHSSEVMFISLTNKFNLHSRLVIEQSNPSEILKIFNLPGLKQFIVVTRFGMIKLFDFSSGQIQITDHIVLTREYIETAIMILNQSILTVVCQNRMINLEIIYDKHTKRALRIKKTRIIPLDEPVNNIIKISEDQLGYCDEAGNFGLLTVPCKFNGNKMMKKTTKVCNFPVDNVFILESKPNDKLKYRTDIIELLMINYEGRICVFNLKKRKRQSHNDPKLVKDICLNSQNIIITKRSAIKTDLMILSDKTLKKLIIDRNDN